MGLTRILASPGTVAGGATRGVRIHEDYERLPTAIPGDPRLLFHAFSNRISNAIIEPARPLLGRPLAG
jgi:signal transduction histidine kinase